uniref:Uncharacterized protein n=1 Tax=Anopheles minimus TaxID=112268 RepID=A0A182WN25_9DIPT
MTRYFIDKRVLQIGRRLVQVDWLS